MPATFGALTGFGAPESGGAVGVVGVVGTTGVAGAGATVPPTPVVESPADEYTGLADDGDGALGGGTGSFGICQSSHFELDHGLEPGDSNDLGADALGADEPDADELSEDAKELGEGSEELGEDVGDPNDVGEDVKVPADTVPADPLSGRASLSASLVGLSVMMSEASVALALTSAGRALTASAGDASAWPTLAPPT